MDIVSTIRKQLSGTPLTVPEPDYSGFTLIELFTARYSIDKLPRESSLEYEIQKRCEHIRQQMNGKARAADAAAFKPYGLRAGVILFCLTVGPFLMFTFLSGMSLIKGVDDTITLSGVWALLTLPALVMISMIGGRIDAERIIKCFNLSGHKAGENKNYFYEVMNALQPYGERFSQHVGSDRLAQLGLFEWAQTLIYRTFQTAGRSPFPISPVTTIFRQAMAETLFTSPELAPYSKWNIRRLTNNYYNYSDVMCRNGTRSGTIARHQRAIEQLSSVGILRAE